MGLGAIGRALAKGVSGAANMGAGLLAKDYERQGDTAARMSLEEHAAALREKLELQRQKFQTGERVAGQEFTDTQRRAGETFTDAQRRAGHTETMQRQSAQDAAAMARTRLTEGGANRRAAMSDQIAQQRVDLDRRAQVLAEEGKLPPEVKLEYDSLGGRISALDKQALEVEKNETMDPAEKERQIGQIRARQSEIQQQQQTVLGRNRSERMISQDPTMRSALGRAPSPGRPPIRLPGS